MSKTMQKGLVSIITPCYNTGGVIHRLLDSVLEQVYPSISMFVIDDGSADNSKEVILSYIPLFEKKGYNLEYRYQSNQGQSAAINNALKWVDGEFLTWPDSDDFYNRADAISSFVNKFRELEFDFAIVRCFPTSVDEISMRSTISCKGINLDNNQFYNCLYDRNFIWAPGNYMVRTLALDKVNPIREIYVEKNAGQNWQMLLPLLYSFKCYTLSVSLFSVLERRSSHSRGMYKTYNQKLMKISAYENTILHTLDNIQEIPEGEKAKLKKNINIKYLKERMNISFAYSMKEDSEYYKEQLFSNGATLTNKERMHLAMMKVPFLYRILMKVYSIFRYIVK